MFHVPRFTCKLVPTQHSVRLQLAKLDTKAFEDGNQQYPHEEITPSIFISSGLDLEELQCVAISTEVSSWI